MQPLKVYSKSEVGYIPYKPAKDARLDLSVLLKINFSKNLLVYRSIAFLISTGPVEDVARIEGRYYRRKLAAKFSIADWQFFDRISKKMERIVYGIVELDTKMIPPQIPDVLLFHELREMYYQWIRKYAEEKACKKARQEERKYAAKFLSAAEMRIYKDFKRAYKPVLTKIIESKSLKNLLK